MADTWSVLYRDGQYDGLIRQDSSLKVWIVPPGLTTPEFLYDFGAAQGDTIRGIRTFFITSLDTVVVDYVSSGAPNPRNWGLRSIGNLGMGMEY